MSQIIVTQHAAEGINRCRLFLSGKNTLAAKRASQAIKESFASLKTAPERGRPLDDLPKLRELMIPFGVAGYVALYRYDKETDFIYILAFRHQKEIGY